MLYKNYFKRLLDILISFSAILILTPFFFIFSIAGFFVYRGNPFFVQERTGHLGEAFNLIKFKSMRAVLPDEVDNYKLDKERLDAYGKFLRRFSLDELPNLLNVLLGSMSFVGPRPLLVKYLSYFSSQQMKRHEVKPGITGLAQVSGRNNLDWDQKLMLDVEYIENITFINDFKIFLATFKTILLGSGVQQDCNNTMEGFITYQNKYLTKSKRYKAFHYSVLSQSELDYLHTQVLDMFLEIKRIFDLNNIDYMVCGGTLLGAYTTGNFIPWDDDFDMCIFSKDYDRAWRVLQELLPNEYAVQCPEVDSKYYLGWMKVRDKNSHVYPDAPMFNFNGVWVDIYCLVEAKENEVEFKIAKEEKNYIERRYKVGGLTKVEYEKRIISDEIDTKVERAIKLRESNQATNSKLIIWSASKIVIDPQWIYPLSTIIFEGHQITTFNNPHEYLISHYGDSYFTLPDDKDRTVGINKVDYFK